MLYQIKDLTTESKKVNIVVKLIAKAEPRYAKGFKIVTFTGSDPTGTIPIPFWNNDADAVKVGDFIEIENGYISVFRETLQLNIGKYGNFQHVQPPEGFDTSNTAPSKVESPIPVITPVEHLEWQTRDLTLQVFLKEKLEERTVHTRRDGKEHRVATFLVGDATGCIYLSLWDEWIDLVEVGTAILIQEGYVRTFRGQRFLNLSRKGKVVPSTAVIDVISDNNLSEKVVADVTAGSGAEG